MSKRAEIAALRAYPKEDEKVWHSAFGIFKFDKNAEARKAYQEGYEQAKKDLALTKDDVKSLIEIWMNLPDFPQGRFHKSRKKRWIFLTNKERNERSKS